MDEELRKEVRLLKALQNISYKEIAELLGIKQDSLYSWLKGYYDFGTFKHNHLQQIIDYLKE